METIKGYKVFNPDWTCRGFQYRVGETFVHNGNIKMCRKGFHFCRKASDCFNYYNFNPENRVAEVTAYGTVAEEGDKCCTDKLEIIREISWQELLEIVNMGKGCTGLRNTGNRNSGNWNTGNRNSGDWNTGDWNTGNRNSGDWNSGNWNSGDWNTGDWNTGNRNSGDWNSGNWNTGNRNSGDWNSDNWNTGDWNTGNRNSGDCNTGDWNTGSWNSTNFSTGFFNSIEQPVYIFNKPTDKFGDEIINMEGMRILRSQFKNSWWVYSENMSDEEKKTHPEHETVGGYLKTVDFKTACKLMWDKLNNDEKSAVMQLPNFDAEVFENITGINVNE